MRTNTKLSQLEDVFADRLSDNDTLIYSNKKWTKISSSGIVSGNPSVIASMIPTLSLTLPDHLDNAAAVVAGLTVGQLYQTAGAVKIVTA